MHNMFPALTKTLSLQGYKIINSQTGSAAWSCGRRWFRSDKDDHDDVVTRIKISPIKRTNEPLDKKRARLIYQSRKRGILETDLLLSGFAAKYLKKMNEEELEEYDSLLNELDWDIYYWATKNFKTSPLPDKWANSKLLKQLQEFSENKEKEILSMPDLSKYQ
ncbi:succinate dehydrogenase assembly factor SDH5 [Saccharomyces cerevisiae]|nr:succinate dehydrogenase assembly factor SDH5 [Saccharomyces cerevisiae]